MGVKCACWQTCRTPVGLCVPVQDLRQLLQQQSSESSAALDAERSAAVLRAHESAAAAAESAQAAAAAALHAAEVRTALLEGQLEVTEQERDALQQQVCDVIAQNAEARPQHNVEFEYLGAGGGHSTVCC